MSYNSQNIYIGKKYVDDHDDNCPQIEEDVEIIRHSQLPENTRILTPDSLVTLEYNKDRLNITIDDDNIIIKENMG